MEEEIEDLKSRVASIRRYCLVWKEKLGKEKYEELETTIDSVCFYIDRLELRQACTELEHAISIIKPK